MKIESGSYQAIAPVESAPVRVANVSTDIGSSVVQTTGTGSSTGNSTNASAVTGTSVSQKTVASDESYVEFAKKPKQDLSMDESDWIKLIERANKALNGANKSFEYSIHEKTKQIMVKVIDKDTKEVIREIPSEKVLDMVAKMWEMAGLFIDERR